MTIGIDLLQLIAYSDHERARWKAWITSDPSRLTLPFQNGGRFPTIASVFDHLFLVERRHLSRLEGAIPPDATGIPQDDWEALFEYGDLVRADLRKCVDDLDDAEGNVILTFTVQSGTFSITRRKLAIHILLHEIRHLAQVAYAARVAGHAPPGEHDYLYCPGV